MRSCALSSQVRKLFAAGLALALLSGCSTTTFESPPSGTQVACDPRLVGQWLSPASCRRMQDDDSEDDSEPRQDGYMILRYAVAPDRIAIHNIDTVRVAQLIAEGTLPGSVENTEFGVEDRKIASVKQLDALLRETKANDDEPQIGASVKGSSRQIDALLASRKDLFFATPGVILRRDGKTPPAPPRKPATKPSPRAKS